MECVLVIYGCQIGHGMEMKVVKLILGESGSQESSKLGGGVGVGERVAK
jgi:hypothetical protein